MSEKKPKKLTNRFTYIFAVSGVMGVVMYNGLRRQIFYQGIYKHAIVGLLSAFAGTKYGEWGDRRIAVRDWILEEYMQRHPEDFQKPPVPLAGEMLYKWRPIR